MRIAIWVVAIFASVLFLWLALLKMPNYWACIWPLLWAWMACSAHKRMRY